MTHDLLVLIWRSTLVASVAICFVLALRLPIRRWLGAQAAYLLWTLVPSALLAAMLPAPTHPLAAVLQVVPAAFTIAAGAAPNAMPAAPALDRQAWLLAIWCIGAIALLLALVWQQRRYLHALGGLVADDDGALRAQGRAGSPALVGALRPRIVLPHDFDSRFDARERELVLAHERAHLAHGDAQINALIALLRCLNWFNPLFHFAASRLRFDQELACDAHVINRFPEARRPYADAMLKAQLIGEARQELRLPIGCYWPSTHPLKERIAMLKSQNMNPRKRALARGVVVALALSTGYASWAAQPGAPANSAPAVPAMSTKSAAPPVIDRDGLDADADGDSAPSENLKSRKMRPPKYPPAAIVDHIQGKVVLKVQVDAEGTPLGAEVVSAEPKEASVLADAAISAAMQWRYNPGVTDGKPVGGYLLVPVDFSLTDDETHERLPRAASQSVIPASYRRMRPPQYPASALAGKVTGTVWVRAHLNGEGAVTEAHAEQTYPLAASDLAEAAVGAIKAWTFNPATVNGAPVEGDVIVPLHFAIDGYTPQASSEPVPVFPPQTPLLAMVTITGPRSCGKDCPPQPSPAAAPIQKSSLPPQPVNTSSITPAVFDIFPAEDRC